jgi:hypothetical protein
MAALQAYDWPGNVRALRHAAERAVILAGDGDFTVEDFSLSRSAPRRVRRGPAPPPAPRAPRGDLNLERAEKQMVEQALKKHAYNISLAAPSSASPAPRSTAAWTSMGFRSRFAFGPGVAGGAAAADRLRLRAGALHAGARRGAARRRPALPRARSAAVALHPAHQPELARFVDAVRFGDLSQSFAHRSEGAASRSSARRSTRASASCARSGTALSTPTASTRPCSTTRRRRC